MRDPALAFDFYHRVFGMVAVYRQDDFIQAQTPGTRDVLVFERSVKSIGAAEASPTSGSASPIHSTSRLPLPLSALPEGRSSSRASSCPANHTRSSAIATATVEIWFEIPTPVDPPPATLHVGPLASTPADELSPALLERACGESADDLFDRTGRPNR